MAAQRDTIPMGPFGPWLPQRTVTLTITPAQARAVLNEYNGANRRFRPVVSKAVAQAIKSGEWRINGETIIFGFEQASQRGVLLDGQNRLQGCILADCPFTTGVAFGLDPSVFTTIDRGSSRNLADDLSTRHEKDSALAAAVLRLAISYCNGIRSLSFPTISVAANDAFEFLESHPEIRESISFTRNRKKSGSPVAGRVIGVTHFLFGMKDAELRDEFFEKLFSGADMAPGNPILAARNRLWQDRMVITHSLKGNSSNHAFASVYILIVAWNHLRRGNSISKIQMFRSGDFKDDRTVMLPEII